AFLCRAGDDRRGHARRRIEHRGGGGAGRRDRHAVVVGGGGLGRDGEAFVAFLHHIAGAAADRALEAVGRAEPLIGDGVVALSGAGRGAERLAFLCGGSGVVRGQARSRIERRRGGGAGLDRRQALLIGRRRHHVERVAFIALADEIAGAGRALDVDAVALPAIGDGVVALPGARRGGERLAFL